MDLNQLHAKLLKAELRGDNDLIDQCKLKIEQFKNDQERQSNRNNSNEDLLIHKKKLNEMNDELNRLNSKLIKAEMMNNKEQIENYQKMIKEHQGKIEELTINYSKNCGSDDLDKTKQRRNRVVIDPELVEELNKLNAKLIKAEMLKNTKQIEEFSLKIKEVKDRMNKEPNGSNGNEDMNEEKSTMNKEKLIADKEKSTVNKEAPDKVNHLKAQILKAELFSKKMVDERKKKVDEIMVQKGLIKNENEAPLEFNVTDLFENLIQACKINEHKLIDQCKEKILKFESEFDLASKSDLMKLVKLTGDSLAETMKTKSQEEMNGNLKLVNDLDKRAKAIRKKNIEYNTKLEELIKKLPVEPKPVKPRVNPLFAKPEPKIERYDNVETRTVIKKISGDNMTLKQMFVSEKKSDQYSEDKLFVQTSSGMKTDEYDDDSGTKRKKLNNKNEYQLCVREESDESCDQCLTKIKKSLLIAYEDKIFMVIPERKPLLKNQLIIRSFDHFSSLATANEDVIEMVNQYKQKLSAIFDSIDMKLIFVEYYFRHSAKWNKHFNLICFPIPEDHFETSKMYFKKGISESESEWSLNKKLLFLKNEPIHKKVPKEMSYFCVTFGPLNDGFAHVIEEKDRFSKHFAEEIIGGMLNIEPENWLKPGLQGWSEQEQRSNELKKLWSKFDVKTN